MARRGPSTPKRSSWSRRGARACTLQPHHTNHQSSKKTIKRKMNRLFGSSSSKTPKPTLNDAIQSTESRIDTIEVKIRKLDAELIRYKDSMKKLKEGPGKVHMLIGQGTCFGSDVHPVGRHAAASDEGLKTEKAVGRDVQSIRIRNVGQRKSYGRDVLKMYADVIFSRYESQLSQLQQQTFNMEQAIMTTENLRNTMATVDAMKQANKEMSKQYKNIDIDKIESISYDMEDLIEQANEVQESLGRSYGVPDQIDEDELQAELDALGDDLGELENPETNDGIPSYLKESDTTHLPDLPDTEVNKPEEPMKTTMKAT
ncbi:hypothetical protein PSHT_09424 [Puccinia striiformis]|uniref:Charged multivesicular body protein 5 n=1 Tax=Puccinia striiformis TaxID=27350 RepID=A0A2S4VH69_9BASI|nr:hypothetical protein PSHT_09424 [Puccinia striiformis]